MSRILVVDDHEPVRANVRKILESSGHMVFEACNGLKGMRALTPDIDLVITDVIMPEMDGLEMVRHVRSMRKDLPILVITGGWSAPSDLVSIAVKLGADRAMSKSRVLAELASVVGDMLAPKPASR